MAPSWWRHPQNKLKKCQEFLTEACDVVPHDGCCSATPCVLCIEFQTAYDLYQSSATFATSSWTGTLNGISFVSYWERNESGECEYIVTFGGYEVYRATCYQGASCRNPAGEAEATVGTETGTLRWSVYEPRELELIDDPDTGCRDFFCDSCRCSCDCLCVTITETDSTVITGEICDVAYQCDPPLWAGTIGYYDLSFTLGRDQYGNCIITPTVNGDELDPVAFPGCADAAGTITLYDGTTIAVRCKKCWCEEPLAPCCGCPSFGGNDGCLLFSVRGGCVGADRYDLNWVSGRSGMPASPTDWGTTVCEMSATINVAASIPGCGGADIDFTFVIFQIDEPSADVSDIISGCEWAMEIYADGVYLAYYLEYSSECQINGADDPLAWIIFPNVDIGGLGTANVVSDFTIPSTKCS